MNKKLSKVFALALALIMCMTFAMPVFADTPGSTEESGSITIKKNLIMNSDASVPKADFTFTLEAYTGTDKYPLFDGIMKGVKANDTAYTGSITVSFDGNEVPTAGLPSDATPGATTGKQYATEEFTIDFTGVTFPKAGVYRYIIKENDPSSPYSITSYPTQYIDVYVQYAPLDGGKFADSLSIQGIFMHTNEGLAPDVNNPTGSKSSGFDNAYTTYNLTIEKYVSGNQASKNDYFKFKVEILTCPVDDTYSVDIANANYEGNTASTELEVTNHTGSVEFYLKHGDNVTVKGLPVGTKYTISEVNGDYTASYTVIEGDEVKLTNIASNQYETADGIAGNTTVTFTNTLEGAVPTGILLAVAPFAALMVIGVAGVLFVVLKKKHYSVK